MAPDTPGVHHIPPHVEPRSSRYLFQGQYLQKALDSLNCDEYGDYSFMANEDFLRDVDAVVEKDTQKQREKDLVKQRTEKQDLGKEKEKKIVVGKREMKDEKNSTNLAGEMKNKGTQTSGTHNGKPGKTLGRKLTRCLDSIYPDLSHLSPPLRSLSLRALTTPSTPSPSLRNLPALLPSPSQEWAHHQESQSSFTLEVNDTLIIYMQHLIRNFCDTEWRKLLIEKGLNQEDASHFVCAVEEDILETERSMHS
ncbi:hypothetical protein OE88DRAFT_1738025 [Heliocybe sulcata]|uniref:Uncharacterized protein n=1 Tax=Heliocybe sulcata TaxID=5364 RepID=A0A5C3MUA2_9AGAM|nr:hypothetical protein OE88DRAFT_1738025 [Heliocybe sulcata]